MPSGFLGTDADLLMDLVVVSFVVLVPALLWSWGRARAEAYAVHKKTQLTLAGVLAVAVTLFEIDIRMQGGLAEMTKGSAFAGTPLLVGSLWFHVALATATTLLWIWLLWASLRRFPKPPAPAEFSATHRFWGRVGMVAMLLTGVTGIELYVLGFVY